MPNIQKVTTPEQAAAVFNEYEVFNSSAWQPERRGVRSGSLLVINIYAFAVANYCAGYYEQCESELTKLQGEIEGLRYVPGEWKCTVCGFRLHRRVLYVRDGSVGIDTKPEVEPCPNNDGGDMQPLTWQESDRLLGEALERVFEEGRGWKEAIIKHRSQKADDRCVEDDDELYEALGDGIKCDRRVGDKLAMLHNCARFIENRCEGGKWKSYAELEAENARLKAALEQIRECPGTRCKHCEDVLCGALGPKPEAEKARREIAEVFPPGEFIAEEMKARGLRIWHLATFFDGEADKVNEILKGERPITIDTASRLEKAFGISGEFWLNLEASYRQYKPEINA